MTHVLIEQKATEVPSPPTADELKATYDTLDRLWDAIFDVGAVSRDEDVMAITGVEYQVIALAKDIVHRHMLVTKYPSEYPTHYRVTETE